MSNVKQDYLMNCYSQRLGRGLMIGVGAVFLYEAGLVKKGPEWLKKLGMRWIYRVMQEPRRQFRNTVPSVLHFIWLVIKHDIFRVRLLANNAL